MMRRCAGRVTAVRSPSPVLSGVPLPTPPKSAEDFARNTQHGRQRFFSATLQCFSCARAQLPASLADNGKPMPPRDKDRKPPLPQQAALSRHSHAVPAASAFKADVPGKRRSAAARHSMFKYSRPLNTRNMPEHFPQKHCHAAADRCAARKALFFPPSLKNFCVERARGRLLFRRAVRNPDLTPLSGAVRLFSSNPKNCSELSFSAADGAHTPRFCPAAWPRSA